MHGIKAILFDIGGVLYVGDRVIEGAIATIKALKQKYPVRFLTNSTRRKPDTIAKKLLKMGFEVKEEELFTALDASRRYVESKNATVLTILTDEADSYFADLVSDKPQFVVVGDAHTNFSYERMNLAFRALMDGASLIAAAKNRYFKDSDERLSMDAGGFIKALEYAANCEAKLIGKPNRDFFLLAVESMGVEPKSVLMVGDDIESDIGGAKEAGLKTALVKTGKFQEDDLNRGIEPDLVVESVADLGEILV